MKREPTLMEIYGEKPTTASPMTGLIERCNVAVAKPISKLNIEEICTFVRQGFYKEVIAPIAISKLEEKIEIGGDWDAELIQSIASSKEGYFSAEQIEKIRVIIGSYSREEVLARIAKEDGLEDAFSVVKTIEAEIENTRRKFGF